MILPDITIKLISNYNKNLYVDHHKARYKQINTTFILGQSMSKTERSTCSVRMVFIGCNHCFKQLHLIAVSPPSTPWDSGFQISLFLLCVTEWPRHQVTAAWCIPAQCFAMRRIRQIGIQKWVCVLCKTCQTLHEIFMFSLGDLVRTRNPMHFGRTHYSHTYSQLVYIPRPVSQ